MDPSDMTPLPKVLRFIYNTSSDQENISMAHPDPTPIPVAARDAMNVEINIMIDPADATPPTKATRSSVNISSEEEDFVSEMAKFSISKHRKRTSSPIYSSNDKNLSLKRHSHQSSPLPFTPFLPIESKKSTPTTSNLMWKLNEEDQKTLIVYQPSCLDHHNDEHQETRQRLSVLCSPDGVLNKPRFGHLKWAHLGQLRPARMTDLMRVHSHQYLTHLESTCAKLPPQDEENTVKNIFLEDSSHSNWMNSSKASKCYSTKRLLSTGSLDRDTLISRESYETAKLAAGAVCHAVDKVVRGENRNAFVIIRPPGHHAGPNGCVENEWFDASPEMCTCGFCLLNNIAIGAAYAMSTYGPPYYSHAVSSHAEIRKVAVIDMDIHHGNGTEEIIRNLRPHRRKYPLPSSWAPVYFSSYSPWRDSHDADNVFFSSIHLYDENGFYPGTGRGPHGSDELKNDEHIVNIPLNILGPRSLHERSRLSSKARRRFIEIASNTFRTKIEEIMIPALRNFEPDIIFISAGFDGHADDFYYFLTEDDYEWMTNQLIDVADKYCDGRLVSVLEGGYNLGCSSKKGSGSNFRLAAKIHNRPIDEELGLYGSLARSCASHVMALSRKTSP